MTYTLVLGWILHIYTLVLGWVHHIYTLVLGWIQIPEITPLFSLQLAGVLESLVFELIVSCFPVFSA